MTTSLSKMAAPTRNELVCQLIETKASVTRPPDYTQAQHINRYSSQYALKNRATKHIFDDESSKTHKQQRVRSAQTRQPSNKDKKGKRRVQSASLSRTREFIAQQAQLIDSQKQVVLFKPTNTATPSASHDDSSYVHTSKVVDKTNSFTETRDEGHLRLPSSLNNLSKFASNELPICLEHPALRGSVVMLPGLSDTYGHDLPMLPSLHDPTEDYPYTHLVADEHIHKPKKYTHPYYERLKKMKGWTCNHSGREIRVGSISGETIHRYTINAQRNKDSVRDEIVELERLIKGLSTDWSRCSTVLYQNEINDLQRMVKHTLSMTSYPETPPDTPDPTGLRKFCKEYDTALQALSDRHHQCMLELKRLEEMDLLYNRALELEAGV